MPLLLYPPLFAMAAVIIGGELLVRKMTQRVRDKERVTYRLSFPSDLSPEQVQTWLRSLSAALRGSGWRTKARPTVVFEIFASQNGIAHRLRIPKGHNDYIIQQIRLAGINAEEEDEPEDRTWIKAVELGLTNTSRQLRTDEASAISTSILATVQSLKQGQAVVMQWVVTSAAPTVLPIHGETQSDRLNWGMVTGNNEATKDEVNDRRRKLEEPNYLSVLRIGTHAKTEPAADHLLSVIRSALGQTRGAEVRFHKRMVGMDKLRERISRASAPTIFPMQLSASEVTALIAWPMDRPGIAGVATAMTRHRSPATSIPSKGRVLGEATQPGSQRPLAVSYPNALRHLWAAGGSGSGKSVLLTNLMAQDMQQGYGVILIDAKSDQDALFHRALKVIPSHRLKDVIILNVDDADFPVGFNILDQGNSELSISQISKVISDMYSGMSQSITAPRVLRHSLIALAETGDHTFIDVPLLLANHAEGTPEREWQDWVVRRIRNRETSLFMQQMMNISRTDRDHLVGPVLNRTWEFTDPPAIKRILGQRKSTFKIADAIRDNKILLVYLNGSTIGQQTAGLIGTLVVNAIWDAVQSVQARRPNFLYLDEFADFINLPVGIEAMLTKARGSNLGLILAHQHMAQLRPDIRASVMANTATKLVFKAGADDAHAIAKEMSGHLVTPEDLQNLARYDVMATIATDIGTSPPVTLHTSGVPRDTGNAAKAIALSQRTYGRPREDVERENETRPGGVGERPRPRRRVSGENW